MMTGIPSTLVSLRGRVAANAARGSRQKQSLTAALPGRSSQHTDGIRWHYADTSACDGNGTDWAVP